ncbi:MAG: bifunctional RNase H/acid phosphatase [Actinomycetes bacterium]
MRTLVVEADGGSRGNPGPAGYGAVVREESTGRILARTGGYLGVASNNVAEYRGLIAGLQAARQLDPGADVEVRMDSKLVVEQMSGRWQVKHPDMRTLAAQARQVYPAGQVSFTWVPRARNVEADRVVNEVLDAAAVGRTWVAVPPAGGTAAEVTSPAGPVVPSREHLVGWAGGLPAPTTLLLLRHGQTELTVGKRFSGRGGADPGLTPTGRAQAGRAAGRLSQAAAAGTPGPVAAVVASPLTRAQQTAEVVAEALGLDVVIDPGFAECDFGAWDGLTFDEAAARWPGEVAAWLGTTSLAPPAGESFDDVGRRVAASRDRLLVEHPGRVVLVVTHVTPIKQLVRMALDAPGNALFRMELAPASLTWVAHFADQTCSLRAFNDQAHLVGLD